MWPQQQQQQQQYMGGIMPPQQVPLHSAPSHRPDNNMQQAHPHHHAMMELPIPSNPRASRNMAEKQRRDNLNTNISTMAALVPTVAGSSRRMDKISILRLAAAYLRTQYTLGPGAAGFLPRQFNESLDLEQYFIDNVVGSGGFFMVVTTTGKIVYISRHVEQQLGHAQNELLGQSLYNFVCPEDHEELTCNLTPDEMQSSSNTTSGEHGTTDDCNSNSSEDPSSPRLDKKFKEQRRSFNLRMSQRAVSRRGEHTQYEYLYVSGVLRLAEARKCSEGSANRLRHREMNSTSNDIVFVGMARMLKKRTITELSLLEASKDEYVTRHLVDGRIIFCDHRISVIAGYMTEEVSGLSAFKFMHKEDVRWTMIGLRQMYDRGEGFGSSCYRLLSKTGNFIYLRTHGYLEFDKNTQTVESFVCINTLVGEEEGIELVKEMKSRFSATISGTTKAMIGAEDMSLSFEPERQTLSSSKASVEDPLQLEDAITHLISDLPSPAVSEDRLSPSPLPNSQYVKAAIYSQRMPPASIQANKIGIKKIEHSWSPLSKGRSHVIKQEPKDTAASSTSTSRGKSMPNGKFHQQQQGASEPGNRTMEQHRHSPSKQGMTYTVAPVAEKRIPELDGVVVVSTRDTPGSPNVEMTERKFKDTTTRSSSEIGIDRPSVVCETRPVADVVRVARIVGSAGNCRARHRDEVLLEYVDIENEQSGTSDESIRSALKRTRNVDEDHRHLTSSLCGKRRNNGDSSYTLGEISFAVETNTATGRQVAYHRRENVDRSSTTIVSFPDDDDDEEQQQRLSSLPSLSVDACRSDLIHGCSVMADTVEMASPSLQDMDVDYQQLEPGPLDISTADDEQLDDLEELQGDVLSPSLDANPDLMKIFDDLRPVMDLEKTIDEAKVQQFAANDQAVSDEIRRTHLQLANSMALRESQFSVLERDLENPALQVQRENFTQLQAEHKKQKQILKTLQQDHHNIQVNVKHNIGV